MSSDSFLFFFIYNFINLKIDEQRLQILYELKLSRTFQVDLAIPSQTQLSFKSFSVHSYIHTRCFKYNILKEFTSLKNNEISSDKTGTFQSFILKLI